MTTHGNAPPPEVRVLGADRVGTPVPDLIARVQSAPPVLPFSDERVAFLADFSRRVGRRARGDGATQALAYWLRKSELARMRAQFEALDRPDAVLVPRGLTFHIPPANVDTIVVYSLALALVTGNRSIVRMSSRSLTESNVALDVLLESLSDHPGADQATALITYSHDEAITAAFSAACDLRVIWGGDDTIARIRRAALPAHARDVTFSDRSSLAAIATTAYASLDPAQRDGLVERFFNDIFWFDQLGCSSPRCLVWVGPEAHELPAEDFHRRLQALAERKGYAPDAAAEVGKLNYAYRSMLDRPVARYRRYGSADTVLEASAFPDTRGEFCGGGLLFQWQVDELGDLAEHVRRQDQTLAVFGVSEAVLRGLVGTLAGRGIDRIVPIGHALDFGRFWDGYDLFAEFTRRVWIDSAGGPT